MSAVDTLRTIREIEERARKVIDEAESTRQQMLLDAEKEAESVKREILARARDESEKILKDAEAKANQKATAVTREAEAKLKSLSDHASKSTSKAVQKIVREIMGADF